MEHMQIATAVYENGVLRLPGPLPGFANGDRVEVAVVRPRRSTATRRKRLRARERFEKEHRERVAALPPDPDE